ncbi:TetR family transcriptional regulator [Streptomyces sp. SCUT-3]|uniref:TetR/AcrR family transcriptional regulator n=1 Tax=Streptomyces sp. SCUT-3 TaxID=2684469 RepID=UPI000CC8BE53|nr:TetR/AcrR family transcriptional regulator [Streptomyces sp. SCUT-3]PLW66205.1 TetR family transcriptional regulator [Streptomyces sp. DJ]QMV20840.1 TetR family transcriptional regulator [Streptomyces sp. SCUT-3]
MNAVREARERARAEVTRAIKDEARRRLAAEGADRLSLRAVARELGMVSSALYRYFPSRDDLLTALIVDAYDALGEEAEKASARADDAPPVRHWVEVCRAARAWALAHPHEYALLYGSPVPGYRAPQATVEPASRVAAVLIGVVREAHAAGALRFDPRAAEPQPEVLRDADRLAEEMCPELPRPVVARLVATWAQLFGLISFEVFGHFTKVVEARDAFFDSNATGLAHAIGLRDDDE